MSSLNNIMQHALKSTSLKKIRFRRDPGNLESFESYEGFILEEDDVSGTATIFVPDLVDSLMNVDLNDIAIDQQPQQSNICSLKSSAMKMLIAKEIITCEADLVRLGQIETIEQLEFYLNQLEIDDHDLLNIYRGSFQ